MNKILMYAASTTWLCLCGSSAFAESCTLDGVTVPSGQSHTSLHRNVSYTRTCVNGVLSNEPTYRYASCTPGPGASCTLDGIAVPHGQAHTFYSTATVAAGQQCSTFSYDRTCNDGMLSNEPAYHFAKCS